MTEFYRLEWTDRRGGFHCEQSRYIGRFWDRLQRIRCEAELWTVDAKDGVKIDRVGGCEPAESPDDKRIKWNWWYDKTIGGAA